MQSNYTAQKMKFSIEDFFSKCDQIRSFLQFPADLVTFTEEILNGKPYFLCSDLNDVLFFIFVIMVVSSTICFNMEHKSNISFTEEILNGQLCFFCSNMYSIQKLFCKISHNILEKPCGGIYFY